MNREIKFRIWLKEKKQMIQDVHICSEYGWLVMSDNDALEEICGRISEKELIWMQYTGLRDKNGAEIYEGDKVKAKFYGKEVVGEIGFSDGCFLLWNSCVSDNQLFIFTDIEVIGNVWENEVD